MFKRLKDAVWLALARFVSGRQRVFDWLLRRAMRTPYYHLYNKDGSRYMMRYWLIKPRAWLPFSARIHVILSPDEGEYVHDHPFDYRTLLLRGSYDEEDIFGVLRHYEAPSTRSARAQTFHRITNVPRYGTTTLFIMGQRINPWGFLVNGRKVNYYEYLGEGEGNEAA